MRNFCLLAAAAALAGCSTAAPPPTRTAQADAHLQRLIGGKVAGAPVSCIRRLGSSHDMVVIDDQRIAFRDGSRVYVNDFRGGVCSRLGSGFYALLTRSYGSGMCSGDIAEVVDTTNGITVGSCVLGDFVPYNRPRA